MLKFHYASIKQNFKDKYDLIQSDTDSLVYSIQHHDINEWLTDNRDNLDSSDSKMVGMKDDTNKPVSRTFKVDIHSLPVINNKGLGSTC